jgi:hypothetical protein
MVGQGSSPVPSVGKDPYPGGVDRSVAPTNDMERGYVRSYVVIRIAVGCVGLLLPLALIVGEATILDAPVHARDSISSYYHSPMRDIFVGSLSVIGVLLITYRVDRKDAEFWASTIAGVCLLGVANFPTERPHIAPGAPLCGDTPQPAGCTDLEQRFGEVTIGNLHLGFAVVALVLLGVIAYLFGRRDLPRSPNLGYLQFSCAAAIALGLLVALSGWAFKWRLGGLTPLYIGEVVTVIAFGIGWLAQGVDLWKWLRQSA